MKFKKVISLLLAVLLIFSTAIPITTAFAYNWTPDYTVKYHNEENWFGYQHSSDEVNQWVKEAVKAPVSDSEGVIDMLTGEIRPGDILSFQVKVEMPTHKYAEIVSLLDTMSLNMSLPYGVNAMITAYCDEVPLLTDDQYNQKLDDFNRMIDELNVELNSDETKAQLETGEITLSALNTYKDLVDNRDKYVEIYKNQLDIGRTQYGIVNDTFDNSSSYGSADSWMGAFEEDPRANYDKTYEEFRTDISKECWVEPSITQEEYDLMVEEFNENRDSIIEEYMGYIDETIAAYESGDENIDEQTYQVAILGKESIDDGTFYNTVMDYFDKKLNGFNKYGSDENSNSFYRFLAYVLTGQDIFNAYSGQYTFSFPDSIVQRNKACTYIFDINIVATKALSVGTYLSVPMLKFYFGEDCPSQFLERDDNSFLHGDYKWIQYRSCSTRKGWLNFGNGLCLNNYQYISNDVDLSSNDYVMKDKRCLAYQYIADAFGDDMSNLMLGDYLADQMDESAYLKALQYFTIEYRDENGNIIKSVTSEVNDSYYNLVPEEIYDYELVGPEEIKGVIQNESTTVTFHYEHKDAEINVSYVDTDGNELAPSQTIKGKTLEEYTSEPAVVYGYEPIEIPENASGVLHEDSADVRYVYDLKNSSVTVNYLDENGEKLSDSEIISGKVFDNYKTEAKDFYGYVLINAPDNAAGTISDEGTSVDYIYKKVFDKLPDKPYQAIYGDKLSDVKLPFGWVFENAAPDDTVGNVGSNTFTVIVPADDTHDEFRGTVKIDVIPADLVEGVDYGVLPNEPYERVYGDFLSSIELPFAWTFEETNPNATVGDVGYNEFKVCVPVDKNHNSITGIIKVNVSRADWVEGTDYDKLPTEPYERNFGDTLASIILPKGWEFIDPTNTTVGCAGINEFDVVIPGDENHNEIKGVIKVNVNPTDWISGIDYDNLPESPYIRNYGDTLKTITLPNGWIFADPVDTTVGKVGLNTFNVIVPADENHKEIKGTIKINVSMADWVEDKDYDKLPTVPYEANYGDTINSITLPKGWKFVDPADTTVGKAGINEFEVVVPADENHKEIKGIIKVNVNPVDLTYDELPETPYEAEYGDTLSSITLPEGWKFVDELDTSVGEVGLNTFAVYIPTDENHNAVTGFITINVFDNSSTGEIIVDEPTIDDSNETNQIVEKPTVDDSDEINPSVDKTSNKTTNVNNKADIPNTGSYVNYVINAFVILGGLFVVLLALYKRKNKVVD